jgi:periplasmic divalent cation tolerance protein
LTGSERVQYLAVMRAIAVLTTVGTEEQANLIAREIVARRQAACVNILPGIRSIYRWKGKICKDGELMLVVKTLESEFEGVAATIRELHSYELPEILSFNVSHGERGFLDWIAGSVDKDADFADDDEEEELAFAGVDGDDD